MPHPIKHAAIPIARPAARKERAFPIPPFPAGVAALSDPSKSCSQRSLFSFSVGAASASGRLQAHPKEIAQISRARKGKEANCFSARLTKAAKYRRISIKQFVSMMECCAVCSARHLKRRFFCTQYIDNFKCINLYADRRFYDVSMRKPASLPVSIAAALCAR